MAQYVSPKFWSCSLIQICSRTSILMSEKLIKCSKWLSILEFLLDDTECCRITGNSYRTANFTISYGQVQNICSKVFQLFISEVYTTLTVPVNDLLLHFEGFTVFFKHLLFYQLLSFLSCITGLHVCHGRFYGNM